MDPPTTLVVQGLYRYVRNPMYLSVTMVVLGEALLTGSMALLAEPTLRRRFGPAYDRYRATVGRWVPRRPE